MTATHYDSFTIKNVETISTSNDQNENKASFLLNDFKQIQQEINSDKFSVYNSNENLENTTSYKFVKNQGIKKRIKENEDFGKKLFLDLKFNNNYYTRTQKWLGHVIEKDENGFKAVLKDLSNMGTDEYSEFSYEEITLEDMPLITKGATFYMSLGFVSNNGTRKKELEIRFQRLIDFDENDVNNKGLDLASELINYFK